MGKETLAGIAVALTFVSYLPYLWSVWRSKTVPHAFSWIIWALLTAIGFAVQLAGGSGAGAWNTGCSAIFCLLTAILACAKGKLAASHSDWITFLVGLAAIPLWYFTSSPFWALVLIIIIDAIAFWLTMKKAWGRPGEEQAFAYGVYALSTLFAIAAIEKYDFLTMVYPLFVFIGNFLIAAIVILRGRVARVLVTSVVLSGLALASAHACSPDQYRIVAFTPALAHWQDAEGQETGELQPTFSGRIASGCRGSGTVVVEIIGRDMGGRQVQQAITAIQNVGPGGAGFDYPSLLPYDARVAGYEAAIVQVR